MKKLSKVIITILIISICIISLQFNCKTSSKMDNIEKKLIRFHVIANSDFVEDQNLKLKVKDEVLKYIQPKLKYSKSLAESRKIIKENNDYIKQLSAKVIKDNGYDYKVDTVLSYENFPIKTYGNITLPQGKYEAYRIVIGEGKGKNWWCVMFPPLCFVDITKGETAYKKTEEEMRNVLTEEEYKLIDNKKPNNEMKIKFKILDIVDSIIK